MKEYNGYIRACDLKKDILSLDKKIDSIGNENIINNSLVSEIESDINNIQVKIKETDKRNFKTACIRNLKICKEVLGRACPFILVAGFVFGLQTWIYDVPFVRQNQYRITKHEESIDNNGIINDNVSYSSNLQEKDSAVYKTKWELKEDGKYYRTIKEYRIDNLTLEELNQMMNNPDFNVDKEFDQINSTKYEVKTIKEITEEDLSQEEGFKIVYRYDDTDVILEAQGVLENILLSAVYLIVTLGICCKIDEDFDLLSTYYFKYTLNTIKSQNKKINIDELKKLFEEEKIKISFVKHQQVTFEDPITKEKILVK